MRTENGHVKASATSEMGWGGGPVTEHLPMHAKTWVQFPEVRKTNRQASGMAQWGKVLGAKPDHPCLVPGTYTVEREIRHLKAVL